MDLQARHRYMQVMGIPVWMPKEIPPSPPFAKGGEDSLLAISIAEPTVPVPPFAKGGAGGISPAKPDTAAMQISDYSHLDWNTLRTAVSECTRCDLSKTRTQTVFGTGNQQATWMVIGEAPGAEEDRQGEPFVGKAGQLLNNMLLAIGMPRETVYIANVLKCRPPNNRDPKADEAANCRSYLERQIALVKPALILVVGRIAAQNLLQTDQPLARLRGKAHRAPVSNVPVVVAYHPAYLLRQPADKRKAWQDLLFAREVFNHHAPTH